MQLTGQLTPLETRKVHPEGKAEQAAFVFLLEPQQSAPLSAKLSSCGVSNRGLRKTAAEASVFVHKSRIRRSPGWPSRVSRPGKSLEVWMITLPEEGLPSAWLNEAEWPALKDLSYKLCYKMNCLGWLRIRKAFLSWTGYLAELFILIPTPLRRFPKSSGPGEHKATAYPGELALLAWLCKIQGQGSGEDSRQYGFDSECWILWYGQPSPPTGKVDNGLEFAPKLRIKESGTFSKGTNRPTSNW